MRINGSNTDPDLLYITPSPNLDSSMADSWNKKEREKKKQQNKKDKQERAKERKEHAGAKGPDDMIAWLDENGNLSSTPPDPSKRHEIKLEDIEISIPRDRLPEGDEAMRSGVISFFNTIKGFGFIRDLRTKESIFVHVNDMEEPMAENTKVLFDVETSPKGPNAVRVKKAPL